MLHAHMRVIHIAPQTGEREAKTTGIGGTLLGTLRGKYGVYTEHLELN